MPGDSMIVSFYRALGPVLGPVFVFLGVALAIGSLIVVMLNRRPAVIAAFLVFLPLPPMIALFDMLWNMSQSLLVIAETNQSIPPSTIAQHTAHAIVPPCMAIFITIPPLLILGTGLVIRSIQAARAELQG